MRISWLSIRFPLVLAALGQRRWDRPPPGLLCSVDTTWKKRALRPTSWPRRPLPRGDPASLIALVQQKVARRARPWSNFFELATDRPRMGSTRLAGLHFSRARRQNNAEHPHLTPVEIRPGRLRSKQRGRGGPFRQWCGRRTRRVLGWWPPRVSPLQRPPSPGRPAPDGG
jgi:hypothetical protein